MWNPTKTQIESDLDGFFVQIENQNDGRLYWMEAYVDEKYHDIQVDWNQYIFFLDDEEDKARKKAQEDPESFDEASSLVVQMLSDAKLVFQDAHGDWFRA